MVFPNVHVFGERDGIEREFDLFHVPPVYVVLNLRAGQERVRDAHSHRGPGDHLDLPLGIVIVTCLAFLELVQQSAIQRHRLDEVRFVLITAMRQPNG